MSLLKAERSDKQRISCRIPLLESHPDQNQLLIPIQARNRTLADDAELDDLVRASLAKRCAVCGLPLVRKETTHKWCECPEGVKRSYTETEINALMAKAEANAEYRRTVNMVRQEIGRRQAGQQGMMRKVAGIWTPRKPSLMISYPNGVRGVTR
jgi:hypothetical protein